MEFSPSYTAYMQHYSHKCTASKSSRKYDLLLKWLPKKISLAVLTRMFTQHMLLQVEFKFWFLRTIRTLKLWFFSTFQPHVSQKSFFPFVSSPTHFTGIQFWFKNAWTSYKPNRNIGFEELLLDVYSYCTPSRTLSYIGRKTRHASFFTNFWNSNNKLCQ